MGVLLNSRVAAERLNRRRSGHGKAPGHQAPKTSGSAVVPVEHSAAATTLSNGINRLQTNGEKAANCVTFVMTLGQKGPENSLSCWQTRSERVTRLELATSTLASLHRFCKRLNINRLGGSIRKIPFLPTSSFFENRKLSRTS